MPRPGDKMYRVDADGEVELVIFVQEQIQPGATRSTYTMRDSTGRRFSCSTDMYVPTQKEALERYLKELERELPKAQQFAEAAQAHVIYLKERMKRTRKKLGV